MIRSCFLLCVVTVVLWGTPAARAEIQVGAAVRVITPDPLLPVSGGMGTPRPAQEKRGELTARAIVFRKGDVSVAVVALDLLGFPSVLGDRVRAQGEPHPGGEHPDRRDAHAQRSRLLRLPGRQGGTHRRPRVHGLRSATRPPRRSTRRSTASSRPGSRSRPARRKGKIAYNYYAPDLYDRRMSVIQAVSPEGKTIATLVNYAIHPEVLGNAVGILSPDLVGPLCERIEVAGRRHGPVHERRPGRDDHGRQPQPRPAERSAARLLGRRAHLGRVPADRPPDGGRGAAARQGRPRAGGPDAVLRLDPRALPGRFRS